MDVPGIALITGAASGIAKACAATFLRDGASGIAMIDLDIAALEVAREEILAQQQQYLTFTNKSNGTTNGAAVTAKPCRIELFQSDVSDETAVNEVVTNIAKTFGRIDYVVNAAGIAMKHPGGAAFCETKDWQKILDVNLNGTFYMLRAAAKIMLKQDPILSSIDGRPLQKGSIVNFGSIQSVNGITLSTAYTTSKHAVLGLTRTASEDYADQGLRINAILPGYTKTPLTTKNPLVLKAMMERIETAVPMRRMGEPQEIADAVVYLSGGRASFVTGSAMAVDGGYTCR